MSERRLTQTEIKAEKYKLSQKMTSDQMFSEYERIINIIGYNMLIQSGLEFMREVYVASKFASHINADYVWLISEDRPDIGIEINGQTFLYEVTEADVKGRKRSDEYRRIQSGKDTGIRHTPGEVVYREMMGALDSLKDVVQNKIIKKYDNCGLIIYLNETEFGWFKKEVESKIYENARPAAEHFKEVWVMWGERFYKVSSCSASIPPDGHRPSPPPA